jgi:uncharacterized Zn finger protein
VTDIDQLEDRSSKWRAMLAAHGLSHSDEVGKKSGQRVTRLEVTPGRISASVDDRNSGPCEVTVDLPVWTDEQWADVIDLLSRQALYAAHMLAGDFSDALEPSLQEAGLSLLPSPQETISAVCTCCEAQPGGPPCPHLDVVLRDAGEMLVDDPWLLFNLRGRVREQVLRALRRKRGQSGDGNGAATDYQQKETVQANGLPIGDDRPDDVHSLSDDIGLYWGSARTLEEFRPHIVRPIAELVLLRRLGPPAFSHANEEVFDILTDVYRRVTDSALALAYAEDPPSAPEESDEDIDE